MPRAVISLSDRRGLGDFARGLRDLGYDIVSTGGTARALMAEGILPLPVWEVTGFPEILDGRVKTLHPRIHGGILARRADPSHQAQLRSHGIEAIDVVAVNLYPFVETVARPGVTLDEAIEQIDIGGPSLIRAAAKNWADVWVVVNPDRYADVLAALRAGDAEVALATRRRLALEAFQHTAAYDAAIADYLAGQAETGPRDAPPGPSDATPERSLFPSALTLRLDLVAPLRYGENPHQPGALYRLPGSPRPSITGSPQLQGKQLSYNNLLDATAALELVQEFRAPAAVAVKHTNPCGVAIAQTLAEAFERAREADPVSIFGGIVALNRPCDAATARRLKAIFLEVVVAPEFEPEARQILAAKKDLRLIEVGPLRLGGPVDALGPTPPDPAPPAVGPNVAPGLFEFRRVSGGLLVQELDQPAEDPRAWRLVSGRAPDEALLRDAAFAWSVVQFAKSNAIVLAKDLVTTGIGAGQTNRIDAARQAIERAGEKTRGGVLASDAFFPFPDVVQAAAEAGVALIVQPGGSIRDEDSIRAAEEAGLAMLLTGVRHFRH